MQRGTFRVGGRITEFLLPPQSAMFDTDIVRFYMEALDDIASGAVDIAIYDFPVINNRHSRFQRIRHHAGHHASN